MFGTSFIFVPAVFAAPLMSAALTSATLGILCEYPRIRACTLGRLDVGNQVCNVKIMLDYQFWYYNLTA